MRMPKTSLTMAVMVIGVIALALFDRRTVPQREVAVSEPRDISSAVQVSDEQAAAAKRAALPTAVEVELGGGVTMDFVLIPPGTFIMGSPAGDLHRYDTEQEHPVTITMPYYLAAREVTRAQFARFVEATDYRTDAEQAGWAHAWTGSAWDRVEGASWRSPGFEQGDDDPVVVVSWHDAIAFCVWLSRRTRRTVRLPTEAEWEHACRAGSTTRFWYGDDLDYSELDRYAWYGWNTWDVGEKYPHRVGQKEPNPWGLYDMRGNVWEWCADRYGRYPTTRQTDPMGPSTGEDRVVRGGSWITSPWYCRSALRKHLAPQDRDLDVGFRCAWTPVALRRSPSNAGGSAR